MTNIISLFDSGFCKFIGPTVIQLIPWYHLKMDKFLSKGKIFPEFFMTHSKIAGFWTAPHRNRYLRTAVPVHKQCNALLLHKNSHHRLSLSVSNKRLWFFDLLINGGPYVSNSVLFLPVLWPKFEIFGPTGDRVLLDR